MNKKILTLFEQWKEEYTASVNELTELDSAGGDGDLGIVMSDGFSKLYDFVSQMQEEDIGKIFYKAGKEFNRVASSSMGTLISFGMMTAGKKLKNQTDLNTNTFVEILSGVSEGVQQLGKAKEGEKTFLDAICPATRAAIAHKDQDAITCLKSAVDAAKAGIENAKEMEAIHGRLAFRKERSIGMIDPGTVAAYHFVKGMYDAVKRW